MTTTTPKVHPGRMPQRRQQHPVQAPPYAKTTTPRRPVQEPAFDGLTSTIAEMNPIIALRQVCDKATDRIDAYGNTVPEGKTYPRWRRETTANVAALLEVWFGLETEGAKLPISPGALKIARRMYVEACLDHKIKGTAGQQTDWYPEVVREIKMEREAAMRLTDPEQPPVVEMTATPEGPNDAFCASVAAKAAQNPLITTLQGNAAILAQKMLALYPSLTGGGAKARRQGAFEAALKQLKWQHRRQHDSIQKAYLAFRAAINAAISELKQ